jgi:hypothetical protein
VWAGPMEPFMHTLSSCQDLQLRDSCFSVDVRFLWYAPDSQPMIFTHKLANFCNVFFSYARYWLPWPLFVSDTFSSLRKTCYPFVYAVFFIALSL